MYILCTYYCIIFSRPYWLVVVFKKLWAYSVYCALLTLLNTVLSHLSIVFHNFSDLVMRHRSMRPGGPAAPTPILYWGTYRHNYAGFAQIRTARGYIIYLRLHLQFAPEIFLNTSKYLTQPQLNCSDQPLIDAVPVSKPFAVFYRTNTIATTIVGNSLVTLKENRSFSVACLHHCRASTLHIYTAWSIEKNVARKFCPYLC